MKFIVSILFTILVNILIIGFAVICLYVVTEAAFHRDFLLVIPALVAFVVHSKLFAERFTKDVLVMNL